jgi:hypothetical protein
MSIVLVGSTSGSITLQEPAVAGTTVLTLPATTGNVVVDGATQTLTNKTIEGGTVISGTAVASTSGTSIDFTSIPSWVKRVTIMFVGVSTTGTGNTIIQIGTGGSPTTSGYSSIGSFNGSAANGATSSTAGFVILTDNASDLFHGNITLCLQNASTNTWTSSYSLARFQGGTPYGAIGGGSVSLAGVLDNLRVTTPAGTATFDAGSINILYE